MFLESTPKIANWKSDDSHIAAHINLICEHFYAVEYTNWSIQIAKIAKDRSRKMNETMVSHNLHQAIRAIDSTCKQKQRQCNPDTSTPSTPSTHHAAKYSS